MDRKIYCSAKAFIEHNGKFLAVKDHKDWDLPGGRMEFGESPQETLLREVGEELGIDVTIHGIIGHWWFFRRDGDQVVCLAFRCSLPSDETEVTINPTDESTQELRWVTREEFLADEYSVAHESLKEMVRSLI